MRKEAFENYLKEADFAPKTIHSRLWVLSTLEKRQGLDLDEEYEKDQLQSLLQLLNYTAEDAAMGRPNPTNMTIDPGRLPGRLSWYRSHVRSYIQFSGGEAGSEFESEIAEMADAVEITFGLEKDMEHALRQNIARLEPGLQVIDGGSERSVEAGFIDILARDADGHIVVIEIKAV